MQGRTTRLAGVLAGCGSSGGRGGGGGGGGSRINLSGAAVVSKDVVGRSQQSEPCCAHKFDISEAPGPFRRCNDAAEAVDRQTHARQDMEADGQSRQALPASADEFKKFAAIHTGHIAGHLSAAPSDIQQVRGPDAGSAQQRALLRVHKQSHEKV